MHDEVLEKIGANQRAALHYRQTYRQLLNAVGKVNRYNCMYGRVFRRV